MGSTGIPLAFMRLVELHAARKLPDLKAMGGAWTCEIGNGWIARLNGTTVDREIDGFKVPPFSALVECDGWPAGLIDPGGGTIAAGARINEAALVTALETAIREAGAELEVLR